MFQKPFKVSHEWEYQKDTSGRQQLFWSAHLLSSLLINIPGMRQWPFDYLSGFKAFFFFFDLSPVVTPNGPMGYGTYLSSYPPGSQERASSWSPVKRWLVILQGSWNLAKAHLELPLAHTDSAGLRSSNQEGNSLKPQRVLCSLRTESLTVTQTYLLCPSVLHLICKDTEMSLCSKEVIFFVTLSWASDPSAPS